MVEGDLQRSKWFPELRRSIVYERGVRKLSLDQRLCGEWSGSSKCAKCSDIHIEGSWQSDLTATPLWMRSTLKEFTVGWRRTPGPTPRPMDMDGLLATGSMRWQG